jgi:hypothetical protein
MLLQFIDSFRSGSVRVRRSVMAASRWNVRRGPEPSMLKTGFLLVRCRASNFATESPIGVPQTLSTSHPHAQRNTFHRRGARLQRRCFYSYVFSQNRWSILAVFSGSISVWIVQGSLLREIRWNYVDPLWLAFLLPVAVRHDGSSRRWSLAVRRIRCGARV